MKASKPLMIVVMMWLGGALLAGCAAQPAEVARQEPAATFTPTPAPPSAPLLLIDWDQTLGRVVRAVDPLTGADAPEHPPLPFSGDRESMFLTPHALTPDGRRLALLDVVGMACYGYAGGETCGPRSSILYLIDVAAWAIRPVALPAGGWAEPLAFSGDGRRLALAVRDAAQESRLLLIDAVTGATLAQTPLPLAPTRLGFAADGATLIVYGQSEGEEAGVTPPPAPRVLLLDGATLDTVWETALDDVTAGHWCVANCDADHLARKMISYVPGIALSPAGDRLYLVHAGADRLTTVDLTRRLVQTVDIAPEVAWFDRLLALTAGVAHAKGPMDSLARYAALSPDGARLYVGGYDFTMSDNDSGGWDVAEAMQPLRALDPATGRVLAETDAPHHSLRLTPDGRRLLLVDVSGSASVVSALDAATLATVAQVEGMDVMIAVDLAGETRFVGQSFRQSHSTFTLLDPLTFNVVAEWPAGGPAWLVAE